MLAFVRKEMSVMLASFMVLLLPSLADSSVHNNHTNIQQNPLKVLYKLSENVVCFLFFAMQSFFGFLVFILFAVEFTTLLPNHIPCFSTLGFIGILDACWNTCDQNV